MRAFTEIVYDQQVFSNNTYYTDPEHNSLLGSAEKLVVQGITQSPSAAIVLDITVEHSNDGRNWYTKTSDVIDNWTISASAVSNTIGTDSGPNGAFVRLTIAVSNSVSGNARLRLIVCGRSDQG